MIEACIAEALHAAKPLWAAPVLLLMRLALSNCPCPAHRPSLPCHAPQIGWRRGHEGGMLLAEPNFASRDERERLCQLMFEVFNLAGYYAADQAVLSLYALGRVSGTVIDVGYGKTGGAGWEWVQAGLYWREGGGRSGIASLLAGLLVHG